MRLLKTSLKYFLLSGLVLLILAGASGLVLWKAKDLKIYSLADNNVSPYLKRGDLVIAAKTPPQKIKPGDIISYLNPRDAHTVIIRRVAQTDIRRGLLVTATTNQPPSFEVVPLKSIIGKKTGALPKMGYLLEAIRQPAGLILFIYIPALWIAIREGRRLTRRRLGGRVYRAAGRA